MRIAHSFLIAAVLIAASDATLSSALAQNMFSPVPMKQQSPSGEKPHKPSVRPTRQPATPKRSAERVGGNNFEQDYGDWRLKCISTPERVCELWQTRIDPKSKSLSIEMTMTAAAASRDKIRVNITTPLGIRLPSDLPLIASGHIIQSFPVVTCVPAGCVHTADVNVELLRQIKDATNLMARVSAISGQVVNLQLGIGGLREGVMRMLAFVSGLG